MSKISQLAALSSLQPDDLLVAVDVHDTTMAASGTDKKATWAQLLGWYNVKGSGAAGDGITDDTAAIQAAINAAGTVSGGVGGSVVYFPPGNYKISSALAVPSFVSLAGAGCGLFAGNTSPVTIFQSSTSANGITLADHAGGVTLSGFLLAGPGSGTGKGIYLPAASGTPSNIHFSDVTVDSFGGNGIELTDPIVSRFERVTSQFNGGHGFYVTGGSSNGTSCTFSACEANTNASGIGFWIQKMAYTSLNGCAAQACALGYLIDACQGVALTGCGAEQTLAAGSYDGTSFKITGSSVTTLTSCWCYNNKAVAFWDTGSSAGTCFLGVQEASPGAGATASLKADPGTSPFIANPDTATAQSVSGGAYALFNSDGFGSWTIAHGGTVSNLDSYGYLHLHGGAYVPAVTTLTFGASVAVDASAGNVFALTLTASTGTLANPSNSVDGQEITIRVIQDGTGSRTLAYGTNYDFGAAGTPALSAGAGKVDILAFQYVGSLGKWCCQWVAKGF